MVLVMFTVEDGGIPGKTGKVTYRGLGRLNRSFEGACQENRRLLPAFKVFVDGNARPESMLTSTEGLLCEVYAVAVTSACFRILSRLACFSVLVEQRLQGDCEEEAPELAGACDGLP